MSLATLKHYEAISTKSTFRLAQRPGSYVVIEYRRPVLKHRKSSELISPPAPANVLEHSLADVSFLAGMLVDKFSYHLPLYRQPQRLAQSGIQLSRGTLTELGVPGHRAAAPDLRYAARAHPCQPRAGDRRDPDQGRAQGRRPDAPVPAPR